MILLRAIREDDVEGLARLAKIPGFINLVDDTDFLRERIARSMKSFASAPAVSPDHKYVFIAEDTSRKGADRILGTSMIASQHGTADSPHFYFEVSQEQKYSDTINTGFIHGTLKLKYDTNGPSEIGGLVVDPATRNNEARVGRQISFVRFLYLGLNRKRFQRKVLAELLPPLNKKGQSPLWEAIGRRFTNMDYWEADQLCQKNKEFIFSLFPSGKIYTTFLTAEARNAIGKVGKDTEPVMHMLKKVGFEYKNQVDPFDGGPHLWANVDELLPVKKLGTYQLEAPRASGTAGGGTSVSGLLTSAAGAAQKPGSFAAVACQGTIRDKVFTPEATTLDELRAALGVSAGDSVAFMPYY